MSLIILHTIGQIVFSFSTIVNTVAHMHDIGGMCFYDIRYLRIVSRNVCP